MRKFTLLSLTIGACATTLCAAATSSKAAPRVKIQMPPAVVEVCQTVAMKNVTNKEYVGKLNALYDIGLPARVSGLLEKQLVNHGDFVKEGQLLFVIEDTTYRAKVETAKALVAQYEAELRFSQSNLTRNTTLGQQQAVSQSAYEESVRLHASNQAKLASAKAALLDAENNLSYTKIYSPITGRIGKCTYSPFNYVTPSSDNLATVVSIDPINVDFSISERDFLSLFGDIESTKKNALIHIRLADGSLYPEEGKIIFLDNKVDADTDTVMIRAQFKNPNYKLIPDGLVTVLMARRQEIDVCGIPLTSLMVDNKGSYVYVVDGNNIVSRRDVITGISIDGTQIVLQGLKTGETVVSDGTHKVRPGGTIKPVIRTRK